MYPLMFSNQIICHIYSTNAINDSNISFSIINMYYQLDVHTLIELLEMHFFFFYYN